MKKLLKRAVLSLFLLIALAAIALTLALRGSLPQLDGEIASPISSPVTATRDAAGVAFLSGGTRDDIGFVLGFLHAQERFFQMDLLRRSSAGELAALFGAKALPLDRDKRRHRFRARARAQVDGLPPDQRAMLEHYTAGVNAGLNALSVRPFEYLLLRDAPQPWKPEDTLLVVVSMYFDLQHRMDDKEYLLTHLADLVNEDWYDFINADGGRFDASLFDDAYADPVLPSSDLAEKLPKTLQQAAPNPDASAPYGSNNWAVSGAHTEHGAALVANDMHLGLRLPHIWYRAGWALPDGRAMHGLTLPGTPLIVVGSNGKLAWGFTNSYVDTVDILRLQRNADGALTTLSGDTVPTMAYSETIAIKGGDAETLDVVNTPFGPIVGEDKDGNPLVFQWTAYSETGLNMNLLEMEQLGTVEQALDAAPNWGIPTQNLVVGDDMGSIGWIVTGPIPIRAGYTEGISTAPWRGYANDTSRPRLLNPPSGRIWTANSRVVDQAFDIATGNGSYALGARSQQIRDLLMASDRFAEADFMQIGLDNRALFLTRWYEQLQIEAKSLTRADMPAAKTILAALQDWNGKADAASSAHLAVSRFRAHFHAHTLGRIYAEAIKQHPTEDKMRLMDEYAIWALISQKPLQGLLPDQPDWQSVVSDVLKAVADDITADDGTLKSWGDHNYLDMAHPFAILLPALKPWLSMPRVPLSGDDYVPNVLRTKGSNVSERMFIAPGHEDSAVLHMPGGQAGHPLSPYWGAGHDDWLNGSLTPLLPNPEKWRLRFLPE